MRPRFDLSDCLPCLVRQVVEASVRAEATEAQRREILRRACRYFSKMSFDQSPPEAATEIHRIVRQITGCADLYAEAKRRYNELLLHAYPTLQEKVRRSKKPFETAARLALGGNIIDFGLNHDLDERRVFDTLAEALEQPLALNALKELQSAMKDARKVLYLADNAGEIVMDRLFIAQFPAAVRVTVAVKGGPILNDATLDDARAVGLADRAEVISNGFDAPGTVLQKCSAELRERFAAADVVISKGQGNFETLTGCGRKNLFYLLKVKCAVVAKRLDLPLGAIVVLKE